MEEHREQLTTTLRTDSSKTLLRMEEHRQQLLPGIPNETTLDVITPKLPWRALHVLYSVSHSWRQAILTNEIYDARLRANATETVIVHSHLGTDQEVLALYSTRERWCDELPPIPSVPRGILTSCHVIALHGKLYVLQGRLQAGFSLDLRVDRISPQMYVLDLVGRRKWEPCASMLEARSMYGCGVLDGKIYVFGGLTGDTTSSSTYAAPLLRAEVYDPQENKWSSIVEMTPARFDYEVTTLGKNFLLYGGQFWQHLVHGRNPSMIWVNLNQDKKEMPLGVYNPAEEEWKLVEHFGDTIIDSDLSKMFVANEKFYLLSQSGIAVYDADQKSWIPQHTNSFPVDGPDDSVRFEPLYVIAVNDELVMVGQWEGSIQPFQCKDFNTQKREMVWEKTNCQNVFFLYGASFRF